MKLFMTEAADKAWTDLRTQLKLTALAGHLGISRAAVSAWSRVPEDRVDAVAEYLRVTPHQLRPDLRDPWETLTKRRMK